jgi:hypothetical protein
MRKSCLNLAKKEFGVFGLIYSDLADSFQSQRIRATAINDDAG